MNVRNALASMTRKLCIEYIDPWTIEPMLASRLIPLDKGAVRPIGVGEVIRRVIGKCIMKATKEDVLCASGLLQMCAGLSSCYCPCTLCIPFLKRKKQMQFS